MKRKKNRCELRPIVYVKPFNEPEFAPEEGALPEDWWLARAFDVEVRYELVARESVGRKLRDALNQLHEERPTLTVEPALKKVTRYVTGLFAYAGKSRRKPTGKGRGAPGGCRGEFTREIYRLERSGVLLKEAKEAAVRWYRGRYPDAADPKFRSTESIEKSVRRVYRLRKTKKKMSTN